jgi:hypothetical protein
MTFRFHQHYHWVPQVSLLNICWAETLEETGKTFSSELAITGPRAAALHRRMVAADHEEIVSIIEQEIEHARGLEDV